MMQLEYLGLQELFNLYSLHHARLMDIVEIQNFREGYCRDENGELVEKSQREPICFLYRYLACCFTNDLKKALEDTLEFNRAFICPLPESEVRSQTSQAEKAYKEWLENEFENKDVEQLKIEIKDGDDKKKNRSGYKYKGYNYKNTTLIGLLNIIEDEMKILKTIINTKEIKRRDQEGLTKREKAKLEKIEAIKKLKEKGLIYAQIAKELKFSINTIKKYSSKHIN
ncbi:hypothetical protein [Clostridium estertheticum]|uniref:hypothetical protein n=1 Tax=Clostridium estertheticum TaxID=238834 RepID=UPI001C0CC751|nr:hypothetical protein [Clostridium estertheticum]MBU3217428.1 hypothetical protein [Clostridium estertheticum]